MIVIVIFSVTVIASVPGLSPVVVVVVVEIALGAVVDGATESVVVLVTDGAVGLDGSGSEPSPLHPISAIMSVNATRRRTVAAPRRPSYPVVNEMST
ncbi:MAG: hypothetical protein ACN4GK_02720 [Acidimicrobiia bacterium]